MSDATELLREAEASAQVAVDAATEALKRLEAARKESDVRDDEYARALDALDRFQASSTPDLLLTALAALHIEAHGDDKMPFRLCPRQTCRDVQEAVTRAAWDDE